MGTDVLHHQRKSLEALSRGASIPQIPPPLYMLGLVRRAGNEIGRPTGVSVDPWIRGEGIGGSTRSSVALAGGGGGNRL